MFDRLSLNFKQTKEIFQFAERKKLKYFPLHLV